MCATGAEHYPTEKKNEWGSHCSFSCLIKWTFCCTLFWTYLTLRESWTQRQRDRWCWKTKGRRSDMYSCPRWEEMSAVGSLHSSLFSALTSPLWQLTWRHESDDDILWPLPCLTHCFHPSCLGCMSCFMLTQPGEASTLLSSPLSWIFTLKKSSETAPTI